MRVSTDIDGEERWRMKVEMGASIARDGADLGVNADLI